MVGFLFLVLVVCLVMGIPVGFAIGISSMSFLAIQGFPPLSIVPMRMVEGVKSVTLMALPLFILSGEIMAFGSTPRLMKLANLIVGKIPGGLAASAAAGCGFFGAISGSGVATVAAIGGIMGPEMVNEGYGRGFTASLLAGAGVLGIVIPPSLSMVVYGTSSGASIGKMFLAGFIPGFMTIAFLMLLSVFLGVKRGYKGGDRGSESPMQIILDAIPPLAMPFIILGGVMTGVVTATESAVIAVVYAFILASFVYKEMKLRDFVNVCVRCTITSSIILFIMATATPFGWIMTTQNVPQAFAKAILALTSNPVNIYLLMMALLLFLGTFMETNSLIIIMTPILLPLATMMGIDPIHFGIMMILNLAIGGVTPPLAVNLFTSCRIINISVEETFPDVLFVVGVMVLALLLVVFIPGLSMLLPNLFG